MTDLSQEKLFKKHTNKIIKKDKKIIPLSAKVTQVSRTVIKHINIIKYS